jgi:hypothetical protein
MIMITEVATLHELPQSSYLFKHKRHAFLGTQLGSQMWCTSQFAERHVHGGSTHKSSVGKLTCMQQLRLFDVKRRHYNVVKRIIAFYHNL